MYYTRVQKKVKPFHDSHFCTPKQRLAKALGHGVAFCLLAIVISFIFQISYPFDIHASCYPQYWHCAVMYCGEYFRKLKNLLSRVQKKVKPSPGSHFLRMAFLIIKHHFSHAKSLHLHVLEYSSNWIFYKLLGLPQNWRKFPPYENIPPAHSRGAVFWTLLYALIERTYFIIY